MRGECKRCEVYDVMVARMLCSKCYPHVRYKKLLHLYPKIGKELKEKLDQEYIKRLEKYHELKALGYTNVKISMIMGFANVENLSHFLYRSIVRGVRKPTRPFGHGEGKSGKRNCKCIPCKAKRKEYNKQAWIKHKRRNR